MRAYPVTNYGWFRFYEAQYNKTQSKDAMFLAQINLLLHLAFEAEEEPKPI